MLCRHLLAFGAVVQAGVPASAVPALLGPLEALCERMRSAFARLSIAPVQRPPVPTTEGERLANEDYNPALALLSAGKIDRFEFLQLGPAIYHLGEACNSLEMTIARERSEEMRNVHFFKTLLRGACSS